MHHEPPQNFIYSAYRINTEHRDATGESKSGAATAFVLDVGTTPYIVTNRHVIDLDFNQPTPKYKNFTVREIKLLGRRRDDSTYTFKLHEQAKPYFHSNELNDVVLIEARIQTDATNILHWHFGVDHLATAYALDSIEPYDLVCITGFPSQHDTIENRPLTRSGRIASDPRFDYPINGKPCGQCVAYEGFSSPGMSGAPVFAPARGMTHIANSRNGYLVGVNAGHLPEMHGHSGISYFYKSTVILEIIKENNLLAAP